MSAFYTDRPPLVLHDWLKQRIGIPWSVDFRCLARVIDNKITAVIGYEGFTGASCRMHMAGEGQWMTPGFIRAAFEYPFTTLDLPMVFGIVPSGNLVALDIDKRMGFVELLYIPGAHPDGGIHFLQLTREDWRRSKWAKKRRTHQT